MRKVTKAKSVFPTDDSLLKMLYLAMIDITKKWTGRRQDWSVIHAQLAIYFAERMPVRLSGRSKVNILPLSCVMLLKRRQPVAPAAAMNKSRPIPTQFGLYTKFGIDP